MKNTLKIAILLIAIISMFPAVATEKDPYRAEQ